MEIKIEITNGMITGIEIPADFHFLSFKKRLRVFKILKIIYKNQ